MPLKQDLLFKINHGDTLEIMSRWKYEASDRHGHEVRCGADRGGDIYYQSVLLANLAINPNWFYLEC